MAKYDRTAKGEEWGTPVDTVGKLHLYAKRQTGYASNGTYSYLDYLVVHEDHGMLCSTGYDKAYACLMDPAMQAPRCYYARLFEFMQTAPGRNPVVICPGCTGNARIVPGSVERLFHKPPPVFYGEHPACYLCGTAI